MGRELDHQPGPSVNAFTHTPGTEHLDLLSSSVHRAMTNRSYVQFIRLMICMLVLCTWSSRIGTALALGSPAMTPPRRPQPVRLASSAFKRSGPGTVSGPHQHQRTLCNSAQCGLCSDSNPCQVSEVTFWFTGHALLPSYTVSAEANEMMQTVWRNYISDIACWYTLCAVHLLLGVHGHPTTDVNRPTGRMFVMYWALAQSQRSGGGKGRQAKASSSGGACRVYVHV